VPIPASSASRWRTTVRSRQRIDNVERVTVGRGVRHRFGGNIAGGANPALNDELLAAALRELLGNQPPGNVLRSGGSYPPR
jgi:hypothetical protein